MTDTFPIFYDFLNEDAMDEVTGFLKKEFGGGNNNGMIAHEIRSEYVHTDVLVMEPEDNVRTFATFGMGARRMNAPEPCANRVELIMMAAPKEEGEPHEKQLTICRELQSISKYPFRNNTWLGPGHTINASDKFKETFDYDFFLFAQYHHTLDVKDVGEVTFLIAIPVYEDERNWMASHEYGSIRWVDEYLKSHSDDEPIGLVDVPRKHLIPEE